MAAPIVLRVSAGAIAALVGLVTTSCTLTRPPLPEDAAQPQPSENTAAVAPPPPAAEPVADAQPAPSSQPDFFREAVNRAQSAVAIGQSAQSPDDWNLAASRWQQAATLMSQVPNSDPNYGKAQQKVQEYQQNLSLAQQRAKGGVSTSASPAPTPARPDGLVAQIPIIERAGGTPVVPVRLTGTEGSQQFPMLFDTGATATLITPEMAAAIGVVVVNQVTVTVADGRQVQLPIGYVDTLEVGGLVLRDMLVAIGGNVGLLGQDVYGAYGISAGSSVINLYE